MGGVFSSSGYPFPVEVEPPQMKMYGVNMMPLFISLLGWLPDEKRKDNLSKRAAPVKKPKDRYDFTGKSPYTINEVENGRLWKVSYDQESGIFTSDKEYNEAKAFMGLDFMTDAFEEKLIAGARSQGEEFVDVVKRDLPTIRYWAAKRERGDAEIPAEDVAKMWYFVLNMFVVKLQSGSLLLYAPVTVREEVGEFCTWLDNLGSVEWVVVPSSAHTTHIKPIAQRYPNAKIVGPAAAEAKVKLVMDLPRGKFDYVTTNAEELRSLNEVLGVEDIEVFDVVGDVVNAVLVRVNKTLLENDLVYGHDDGEGIFGVDGETLRKCDPEAWFLRVWKFCLINKPHSPHGFLPKYRYWLMDPNSMGLFSYDATPLDGSYCSVMANSLRTVLKWDFEHVLGVHGIGMGGEKFRKTIDKSWSWLDGATLL